MTSIVVRGIRWALVALPWLAPTPGVAQCARGEFDPRSDPGPASRIVEVDGVALHALSCGTGERVVFLHGQPTSTWLWRDVVPPVAANAEAVVLDLPGFGRSERPDLDWSIEDHERLVGGFLDALGPEPIVLVVHDWGSYLGLHWARRNPERVRAVVLIESILPGGSLAASREPDRAAADSVTAVIRAMAGIGAGSATTDAQVAELALEHFLRLGTVRELTLDEMAAYRAPWKEGSLRPVAQLPRQIPRAHTANEVLAYSEWLAGTPMPKLLFLATPGVLAPVEQARWVEENLTDVTTVRLGPGLHFVQEDHGERIGEAIAAWLARL